MAVSIGNHYEKHYISTLCLIYTVLSCRLRQGGVNGGWRSKVIENMTKEANGATVKLPFEVRFDSDGGDILETPMENIEKWTDDILSIVL